MPFIFDHEGREFENDPHDPGGATKFGIDARSHPGIDIKNLDETTALKIYWSEWVGNGCEEMATPLAEVFFDTCVNAGFHRATELGKASGWRWQELIENRRTFYHNLAMSKGTFHRYLKGWLNRCNDLEQWALQSQTTA